MKKAVVIAGFCSSEDEARERSEKAFSECLAEKYPDSEILTGYTKLPKTHKNKEEMLLENVLKRAAENSIKEIFIQPSLIIKGHEYERITSLAEKYSTEFDKISVGKTLLYDEESIEKILVYASKNVAFSDDEAVILVGHGSSHSSGAYYDKINTAAKEKGINNVCSSVITFKPDVYDAIDHMTKNGYKKAAVLPLMFAAGEHVINDIGGSSPESFVSILKQSGIETRLIAKGAGEIKPLCRIWI